MNSTVEKIYVNNIPQSFKSWLSLIKKLGHQYEVIINDGVVVAVHVSEVDNEDWSDIEYGKVVGSSEMAIKKKVFKPAIVNGIFREDM